jgi:hypothetical protein
VIKGRIYLILIAVAMLVAAGIVLVLNRDLPTELLGSIAFLGGVAVLINVILDLTGNGANHRKDD